jgi:hypothetical protein
MNDIGLCECEHWKDEHYIGSCFACKYYYTKYGDIKEHKVSKCQKYEQKYSAELGYIDSCRLYIGERGGLQISICFDFGGSHQCMGGYSLGGRKSMTSKPVIYDLMSFFGVTELKDIVGKYAYAIRKLNGNNDIIGIRKNVYDEKDDKTKSYVWSFRRYFGE